MNFLNFGLGELLGLVGSVYRRQSVSILRFWARYTSAFDSYRDSGRFMIMSTSIPLEHALVRATSALVPTPGGTLDT